jgi:flavin reductase (DIM6/NTAB) family NADH-FMN oxidoreductase RutF
MSFDTRSFRQALGCFPTGVTVVTVGTAERPKGMTVNSFASVSLDPPQILWCMDRKSSHYHTFTKAQNFTVSVLGSAHRTVSDRLAKPGEHSLEGLALSKTENGVPGLADALAVLECRLQTVHEGGDHAIIVGRVEYFSFTKTGAPLVFFRGRYGALAEDG